MIHRRDAEDELHIKKLFSVVVEKLPVCFASLR
jgi:hypothetical protein